MNENLTINGTSIQVLKNYCDYLERNIKEIKKLDGYSGIKIFENINTNNHKRQNSTLDENWVTTGKNILHTISTFRFNGGVTYKYKKD